MEKNDGLNPRLVAELAEMKIVFVKEKAIEVKEQATQTVVPDDGESNFKFTRRTLLGGGLLIFAAVAGFGFNEISSPPEKQKISDHLIGLPPAYVLNDTIYVEFDRMKIVDDSGRQFDPETIETVNKFGVDISIQYVINHPLVVVDPANPESKSIKVMITQKNDLHNREAGYISFAELSELNSDVLENETLYSYVSVDQQGNLIRGREKISEMELSNLNVIFPPTYPLSSEK